MHGTIKRVTFVGDLLQYHVDVEGSEISSKPRRITAVESARFGMPVRLTWRVEDTMVFGRNT